MLLVQMSQVQQSTAQSVEIVSPPSENDGTGTVVPGQGEQEGQQSQKQTRKRKSAVWNFFEEVQVPSKKKRGEMEVKVKCKACGTLLTKNKSGTTSHWQRHLDQCDYFKKEQKSKIQTTINFPGTEGEGGIEGDLPALSVPGFYDPAKIRELICKMIIVHELPFIIVEYTWFNVLLKALNSSYKKVSRATIRNDCMKLYESEKELLRKSLKNVNRISLTCDLWTSKQTICYMSLVAHYIDANWTMHCRVINFMELDPPHSGVVISNAISDCLASWKIEDKIASITFDNASNNDTSVKLLHAKFASRGALWFEGKFLHNRCCAHILNLVVQDGLQVIQSLIDKVRETIKYIKKSNSRSYKFNADIDSLNLERRKKLSLDVCTRWGSTFKMLESAFYYRTAIEVYAAGDANYKWQPTNEEWELYKKVNTVLGVLHLATEEFSGSRYPTSNLFYPHIVNVKRVLHELKQSKEVLLQKMANAMIDKFEKYWGPQCNTLFAIATILDPRFKMGMIKFTFPSLYSEVELPGQLATVESTLAELYGIYENEHNQMSKLKNNESTSECASDSCSTSTVFSSASEYQQYLKSQNVNHPSKSDLRKYLEDPVEQIPAEKFDVLQWWRLNEMKYPVVAKMAKDVLTIPITTVSSESSFSSGGRLIDEYRSSLLPSTVQALVCTSSWIRGGNHKLPDLVSTIKIDVSVFLD